MNQDRWQKGMKAVLLKVTAVGVVCAMAILITGCTYFKTPGIKGVVLDAETDKPIADARIYAKWQTTHSGPGGQTAGVVKKELRIKTGVDGKFDVPAYWFINYLPLPFGQGGSFFVMIYALGYQNKNYTFYEAKNFDPERVKYKEFKAVLDDKESVFKLSDIKNPRDWLRNSGEIYNDTKLDRSFLDAESKLFREKFGKGRWDRFSQDMLSESYASIGDYKSAVRKLEELMEDYPEEGKHYKKRLEEFRKKLNEHRK